MYKFPLDFVPINEKKIIEKIAKKRNLTEEQVRYIYKHVIEFIENSATETSQPTIHIPNLGHMYLNVHRMYGAWKRLRGKRRSQLKELFEYKMIEISEHNLKRKRMLDKYYYRKESSHLSFPILFNCGYNKKNKSWGKCKLTGKLHDHTTDSIIKNQIDVFFDDDKDYKDKPELKEFFFSEYNDIEPEYKGPDLNKRLDDNIEDKKFYKQLMHDYYSEVEKQGDPYE